MTKDSIISLNGIEWVHERINSVYNRSMVEMFIPKDKRTEFVTRDLVYPIDKTLIPVEGSIVFLEKETLTPIVLDLPTIHPISEIHGYVLPSGAEGEYMSEEARHLLRETILQDYGITGDIHLCSLGTRFILQEDGSFDTALPDFMMHFAYVKGWVHVWLDADFHSTQRKPTKG